MADDPTKTSPARHDSRAEQDPRGRNVWAGRVEDHAFVCHDPSLPDLIERAGATLIGYRELRDLQRRQ